MGNKLFGNLFETIMHYCTYNRSQYVTVYAEIRHM